jgi:SAM-dependent methyltransferase
LDQPHISIGRSLHDYWTRERSAAGQLVAAGKLAQVGWNFLHDSLPERKRRRYGDADYDWEFRVNTTSATVSWRTRLLGLLHSPYQPIEPELFHKIINSLEIDFSEFTFLDIGSGKGRALLLAAEFPFRRVVGVELLPELNSIAEENIRTFATQKRACREIQTFCEDATEYSIPAGPAVVFLFNPLPEAGLKRLAGNLQASLRAHPRLTYVIYANPVHDEILRSCAAFTRIGGTHQYSLFRTAA